MSALEMRTGCDRHAWLEATAAYHGAGAIRFRPGRATVPFNVWDSRSEAESMNAAGEGVRVSVIVGGTRTMRGAFLSGFLGEPVWRREDGRKRRLAQLRAHCNATGNVTRRLRAAEALEMRGGWAW